MNTTNYIFNTLRILKARNKGDTYYEGILSTMPVRVAIL